MKRYLEYIIICVLSLMASACVDEDFDIRGSVGKNEVWAKLKFGHRNYEQIEINSRSTLNENAESRVENLFVYMFDGEGKRLYSHYYDYTNRVEVIPDAVGHFWTVSNRTSANDNDTQGEVMIKSPTLSGGSIYLIANLNADQLNISSDQLNMVESLPECLRRSRW